MKGRGAWVTELVRDAWQPDVAEKVIEDLIRVRPDFGYICSRFPDHGSALINFLSLSKISVEKITARPDLLDWLSGPEMAASKRGYWRGWNEDAADSQLAALSVRRQSRVSRRRWQIPLFEISAPGSGCGWEWER